MKDIDPMLFTERNASTAFLGLYAVAKKIAFWGIIYIVLHFAVVGGVVFNAFHEEPQKWSQTKGIDY